MIPVEGWSFKKTKWAFYYVVSRLIIMLGKQGYLPSSLIHISIMSMFIGWVAAEFKNDNWDAIEIWRSNILECLDYQFGISYAVLHQVKLCVIQLLVVLYTMIIISLCGWLIYTFTSAIFKSGLYNDVFRIYIIIMTCICIGCIFSSCDIANEFAKTAHGYDFSLIKPTYDDLCNPEFQSYINKYQQLIHTSI